MTNTRTESDSMGELEVPSDALYGAQTQRAINNFPLSGERMPLTFIRTLVTIKKAAALANKKLETLNAGTADAIQQACDTLLDELELQQHFPVDVFQTGSGTSTNMNANEVIANLANQQQGKHEGEAVHPNDHVNNGQSSNDVIPTTIHASAAIELTESLIPAISRLIDIIGTKANSVSDYCKTGRTHLMDAMPVRMDQSLRAWSAQLSQQRKTIKSLQPAIQTLAQGGTAVGTGVNAHPDFAATFASTLSDLSLIHI